MAVKQDSETLKKYLTSSKLRPRDQLPAERILAENLNMTRSRLRTSLAKLEKEGLIWRHVGQGTFVGPAPNDSSLSARMNAYRNWDSNPAEILEARMAVEPQIAYLAAQRATGEKIDDMRKIIEKLDENISWGEWVELDKKFHLCIAESANNKLLFHLLESIQLSQTPRNWGELSLIPLSPERRDLANSEHRELYLAFKSRNARLAATLIRTHLENVRTTLIGDTEGFD